MTLDPDRSGQPGEASDGEPRLGASEPSPEVVGDGTVTEEPKRRGRVRRFFGRFWPKGRRGQLMLMFMVAGFAIAMTASGVAALQWTETADFCGRCHTMGPELKAHAISAHRELACAECHVEPGIEGWIKAKINGTKQLIEIVTGNFPTPIPPPGHGDLPPTTDTCRRCHDVNSLTENGGPIKFVLKNRYQEDEANTKSSVALVIRPAGLGEGITTKGIHWHIVSDVEFTSADPRSQTIDLVRVTDPDGTTSQFIAMNQVSDRNNVTPDVTRLLSTEKTSRMDCIDCHNRAGHGVPTLGDAVDSAIEQGLIDPGLPFVKKESIDILSQTFPDETAATTAIDGLRTYYQTQFPAVATLQEAKIASAIGQLKLIYELVATPEMQVSAQTYPDNLGHTQFPGCFRCHDGGHYEIIDGKISSQAIPSGCATCHTFPEIGPNTSAILIGQRPTSHLDTLWVFNHKNLVTSLDPSSQSCGACHTKTYCENCHNTPAVQVPHDQMVFNHGAVVAKVGAAACTLCHQQTYCAQCHAQNMLPTSGAVPGTTGPAAAIQTAPGFRWRLGS